jgi:hypothetical protein
LQFNGKAPRVGAEAANTSLWDCVAVGTIDLGTMAKHKPDHYHSVDQYELASRSLEGVMLMVLFDLAVVDRSARQQIVRGFMARGTNLLKGIRSLWQMGDYDDSAILLRCLLERMFTLAHLRDTGEFEAYEEWSFYTQCQYQNKAWEVIGRKECRGIPGFDRTSEESERFNRLSASPPKWKRPKAQDVLKRLNLDHLFHFCYDSSSTIVHPMANDGLRDFYSLTNLEPSPAFPDCRYLLHNSVVIGLTLLTTGMIASELCWRNMLNTFAEEMIVFLETGATTYQDSFENLVTLFRSDLKLSGQMPETA